MKNASAVSSKLEIESQTQRAVRESAKRTFAAWKRLAGGRGTHHGVGV